MMFLQSLSMCVQQNLGIRHGVAPISVQDVAHCFAEFPHQGDQIVTFHSGEAGLAKR